MLLPPLLFSIAVFKPLVLVALIHFAIGQQQCNHPNLAQCRALYQRGWRQQEEGDWDLALESFQQLLLDSQQLRHGGLVQAALLAIQTSLVSDSAEALPKAARPLAIASASKELAQLLSLGEALCHQEQLQLALVTYQKALRQATLLEDTVGIGVCLNGISMVYTELQDYLKAETYCYAAANILADSNTPIVYAAVLHNWGMVSYYQGNNTEAMDCFHQALAAWEEGQHPLGEAMTLTYLGRTYARNHDYCFALSSFQAAALLFETLDEGIDIRLENASLIEQVAQLCEHTHHPDLAIAYYLDAYALYQDCDAVSNALIVLQRLGSLHEEMGSVAIALHYYRQAVVLAKSLGQTIPLSWAA